MRVTTPLRYAHLCTLCTALHYTVLPYTVLYCTVLYYTALHFLHYRRAVQAQAFMLPQLKELLQSGTYQPAPGSVPLTLGSLEVAQAERSAKCRVILTAEQTVPYLDGLTTVIKVR